MLVCLCPDLIFFYVLSDISEVSSPITLCIFKVYFLSLKHHILGSTMLLLWLTEFPKLALVQTQISNISLLQECYSTPIYQLFLSDLPVEAFIHPWESLVPWHALSPTFQALFPPLAILVPHPAMLWTPGLQDTFSFHVSLTWILGT